MLTASEVNLPTTDIKDDQVMPTSAETAVRTYLAALRDPDSLRNEEELAELRRRLDSTTDGAERVLLHQRILDAENPPLARFEDEFVTHAKAWAAEHGVGGTAFIEEGVPQHVLRRAGFRAGRAASRTAGRRARSRVTAQEVKDAIPKGTFTIRSLQERSGASPAVVRNVVALEERAGRVRKDGTDPDHRGPGRAPTLYRRAS